MLGNKADVTGALLAMFNVSVKLTNCLFENNSAKTGSVIDMSHYCTLVVADSLFNANIAGVISINTTSDAQIMNCNFTSNLASGLTLDGGSTLSIFDATFSDMSTGLLDVTSSKLNLHKCNFLKASHDEIAGNRNMITIADKGSLLMSDCNIVSNNLPIHGLMSITSSTAKVQNIVFESNSAKNMISVVSSSLDVTGFDVFNNNASDQYGLINSRQSMLQITKCSAYYNSASGMGGIVYSDSSNISILNSSFSHNLAGGNGGIIYSENSHDYSRLSIMNANFTHNRGGQNGAVLFVQDKGVTHVTDIGIDSCQFIGNAAKSDSALYVHDCSRLRTSNCVFKPELDSSTITPCSIYFKILVTDTDYMSYKTDFNWGDKTLSTSEPNFLHKAVSSGAIKVDNGGNPHKIVTKEMAYAACK